MYTVLRIIPEENYSFLNVIGDLLDDREINFDDKIHSFSLSSEKTPYLHLIEIEKKIGNLVNKGICLKKLRSIVDISVDKNDVLNRNLWSMTLPVSLCKIISEHNIKLEFSIYP